jgi:hypothetical protein
VINTRRREHPQSRNVQIANVAPSSTICACILYGNCSGGCSIGRCLRSRTRRTTRNATRCSGRTRFLRRFLFELDSIIVALREETILVNVSGYSAHKCSGTRSFRRTILFRHCNGARQRSAIEALLMLDEKGSSWYNTAYITRANVLRYSST